MMRVADYIADRLYKEGVKHVFMVTGRGILFLSDAVARHKELRSISMHHEQSTSFAAMAYSQVNNRIGACLVSTGCASTNAITGLLCAFQDDVPCIFVSGQNKLKETVRHTGVPIRTYGQQEADIVGIVDPITKYAKMIEDPNSIAYEMDKAIHLAQSGRKGPVWIDVPLDVQNMRVDEETLQRFSPEKDMPTANTADIEHLVQLIEGSQRPLILIGSGVRSSDAQDHLENLTKSTQIPIVFSPSAVDAFGSEHECSIGAVGSLGGTRAGNFALQNSDLLLVIGHRLNTMTTGEDPEKFAREAKIVVVDIDDIEHTKSTIRIDHFIHSDAGEFLRLLCEKKPRIEISQWVDQCLHWKNVFPKCERQYKETEKIDIHFFADSLSSVLDDDAVIVTDSGLAELIVPATIDFRKDQRCIHPAAQGSMGFALPGAIGAHYSCGKDVIVVVGDGSIMMNLQELQTIRYQDIPIKIFVINNAMYSVIRKRQIDLFRTRTVGTDSSNGIDSPEFRELARCFDLRYEKLSGTNDLSTEINRILQMSGPVLCEVVAVEDQEYLRNSYAHDSKRRIVRRSLEDQAPFLDRDLFLSEMLIDPIDQ